MRELSEEGVEKAALAIEETAYSMLMDLRQNAEWPSGSDYQLLARAAIEAYLATDPGIPVYRVNDGGDT